MPTSATASRFSCGSGRPRRYAALCPRRARSPLRRPTPASQLSPYFELEQKGEVKFTIPREVAQGFVNNTRTNYEFKFDDVLPMDVSQEQVFNRMAKPVVER